MSFNAIVYRVLVASPSDLVEERSIIADIIYRWNVSEAADARTVLLPVMWETHAVPEQGDRPQAIVNRLVSESDILIGAFWTRLGTPTGLSASGTLEEIEQFIRAGKPTLLYFSSRMTNPDQLDPDQLRQVRDAKERFIKSGLVGQFSSPHELREKLAHDLQQQVKRLVLRNPGSEESTAPGGVEPSYESILVTATVPRRDAEQFAVAITNLLPVLITGHSEGESKEYTDLSVQFRQPIAGNIVHAAVRKAAAVFGGQVISITGNAPTEPGSASITGVISLLAKHTVAVDRSQHPFRYVEYWSGLRAALAQSGSSIRPPTVGDSNWVFFPVGKSGARINAFASTRERHIGVEFVLDRPEWAQVFSGLMSQSSAIEEELGEKLAWKEHPGSLRIVLKRQWLDPADRADWRQQYQWFTETLEQYYKVLVKRLDSGSLPQAQDE